MKIHTPRMLIINNKISLIPHAPANRAVAHSGIGTEMWGQPPEAPFATAARAIGLYGFRCTLCCGKAQ